MSFIESFFDELRKLALNKEYGDGAAVPSSPQNPPFRDEALGDGRILPGNAKPQKAPLKKTQVVKTGAIDIAYPQFMAEAIEARRKKMGPMDPSGNRPSKNGAIPSMSEFAPFEAEKRQSRRVKEQKEPVPQHAMAVSAPPTVPSPQPKPIPLAHRKVKTGGDVKARMIAFALEDSKKAAQLPSAELQNHNFDRLDQALSTQKLAELIKEAPFKSQAQRRKFYAMASSGEISQDTLREWEEATPKGKKLPERVKKPKKKKLTVTVKASSVECNCGMDQPGHQGWCRCDCGHKCCEANRAAYDQKAKASKTAGMFTRLFGRKNDVTKLTPISPTTEKKEDTAALPGPENKKGLFRKVMMFGDDIILGALKLMKKDVPEIPSSLP